MSKSISPCHSSYSTNSWIDCSPVPAVTKSTLISIPFFHTPPQPRMAQIAIPLASSCCDSFLAPAAHCNGTSSTRGCQVRALPVRNSFRNDGERIPVKNSLRSEGGERTFSTIPVRNSWSNSSTNSRWVEGERRNILRLKRGGGAGRREGKRVMAVRNLWGKVEAPKPTYVPLEPIMGEEQFDQVLKEAQEKNQPIVIDWLAAWCRKCIYLKPKMEKLAAEFHPDIKFYVVDVNTVPQSLVKRAAVTKMPTIQLWKDGKWWAEVIGGHQAWLVLDEVRVMIGKREKD